MAGKVCPVAAWHAALMVACVTGPVVGSWLRKPARVCAIVSQWKESTMFSAQVPELDGVASHGGIAAGAGAVGRLVPAAGPAGPGSENIESQRPVTPSPLGEVTLSWSFGYATWPLSVPAMTVSMPHGWPLHFGPTMSKSRLFSDASVARQLVERLALGGDGGVHRGVELGGDVAGLLQRGHQRLVLLRDRAQRHVAVREEAGQLAVLVGERLHDGVELHEDVVGLRLVLLVHLRHRGEVGDHLLQLGKDRLDVAGAALGGAVERRRAPAAAGRAWCCRRR